MKKKPTLIEITLASILGVIIFVAATPIKNLVLQGNMDAAGYVITNVGVSTNLTSAATRGFVETNITNAGTNYATTAQGTTADSAVQPGDIIPITDGGTGATNAAGARANLAVPGVVDPAVLTPTNTFLFPLRQNDFGDLGYYPASDFRTLAGLQIGSDVQAYNTNLTDLEDGELTGSKVQTSGTANAGVVTLASDAEIQTGSDTAKVVRVSGLAAWWTWVKTQAQTIAGNWTFSGTTTANVLSGTAATVTTGTVGTLTVTGSSTHGDSPADEFVATDDDPRFPNLTSATYTAAADDKVALNGNVANALFGGAAVLTHGTSLSLFDDFSIGGITTNIIGRLRWTLLGTGSITSGLGQSSGVFGVTFANALTASLHCSTLHLTNMGYTGTGWFSRTTSRTFSMSANIGSGLNVARNRSLSFAFVAQPGGTITTPTSVTPANSFGVRYIMPSQAAWVATTVYSVGYNARPTTPNNLKYICTTAGTSAGSEPTWPTSIGGTVVDGTVTWTCAGMDGNSSHLFQFFVTGADPLVNITTLNSTVAISASTAQFHNIVISATATGIQFAVDGESTQEIASTTAISGTPAFIVRNDLATTFGNAMSPIRYFGFYAANRY